ncbi:MAG TPA: hypothetical protein VFX03_02250, partial [Thermomicrobiales bacterium]|nr:hypothetical protein [Thermomicrobiales bacterium]
MAAASATRGLEFMESVQVGQSPTEQPIEHDALVIDEASQAFVGAWRGLISTTNWEKGRIIHEWREALKESGAPVQEYSDEAWSRRVGQVSGQHAGRLRRVYERFHDVRESYAGLYWSHFQAALDWSDAEMWLEGGVQSGWSVGEMRARRWEALGGVANGQPHDAEAVDAEFDEDSDPAASHEVGLVRDPAVDDGDAPRSPSSARERSRNDDDQIQNDPLAGAPFDPDSATYPAQPPAAAVRPFVHLAE